MLKTVLTANKKIISRTLSVFLIALFVWYFVTHVNDFKILLNINPLFITLLVMIYVSGIVINGLFMKISIALFGKNIKFGESVRVSLISTVGNFFAPAGSGLAFRAVYLNKRHNLAYNDYISIVFCNYILAFFVNAVLGIMSIIALREYNSRSSVVLAIFFLVLLILSTAAFFVRVKDKPNTYNNKLAKRIVDTLIRITIGWRLILANKKLMLGLSALMVANTALLILSTYFIMSAIGVNMSLASLILFSVIGSLSVFVNITPGNLGVKEAIYIVFSTAIGLTTAQILSAALVDRVVLFAVIFLLWLIYGRYKMTILAP